MTENVFFTIIAILKKYSDLSASEVMGQRLRPLFFKIMKQNIMLKNAKKKTISYQTLPVKDIFSFKKIRFFITSNLCFKFKYHGALKKCRHP